MVWRNFLRRAITSRHRGLATATVYGLSLAVRLTSAAGEEAELPAQYVQRTMPVISIMTKAGTRAPYEDWRTPLGRSSFGPAGHSVRQAAARVCETSIPTSSMQDGLRP